MKRKEKVRVGWRELIDLPDWGIKGVRAKIDTGAKSSALHVEDVKELPHNQIEFHVVLNELKVRKKIVTKILKKAHVKSSSGVKTSRWYVETKLRMGKETRKVHVNLVSREEMSFRMLIGRSALKDKFLVDVSRSFLLERTKNKERRQSKNENCDFIQEL